MPKSTSFFKSLLLISLEQLFIPWYIPLVINSFCGAGLNINIIDSIYFQIGIGVPLYRKLDENSGRLYFAINADIDNLLFKPKSLTRL